MTDDISVTIFFSFPVMGIILCNKLLTNWIIITRRSRNIFFCINCLSFVAIYFHPTSSSPCILSVSFWSIISLAWLFISLLTTPSPVVSLTISVFWNVSIIEKIIRSYYRYHDSRKKNLWADLLFRLLLWRSVVRMLVLQRYEFINVRADFDLVGGSQLLGRVNWSSIPSLSSRLWSLNIGTSQNDSLAAIKCNLDRDGKRSWPKFFWRFSSTARIGKRLRWRHNQLCDILDRHYRPNIQTLLGCIR